VVALDRRCPVDLREDRTAETVAAWLQTHPEVTIVARDRADADASGVPQGAPDAVQVAARWHLVKNLRDAVEAELRVRPTRPWSPRPAPGEALPPGALAQPHPPDHGPMSPDTPSGRRAEAARQARRTQRLGQYAQACALRQQGLSMARIARQVGVSPRTLCRWFAARAFPGASPPHGRDELCGSVSSHAPPAGGSRLSQCDPSVAHGAGAGLPGLLRRGVPVRDDLTRRTARTVRGGWGAQPLSYLFVRRPEKRPPAEQAHVAPLQPHDPTRAQIATRTEPFARRMRTRTSSELQTWLETVLTSGLADLKRFATGRQQEAAVRAAFALPSSNGQTEGQVTRLKLLKRQMYGRAKLDLLRQRVLHAA
jgi:transposase